MIRQRQPRGIFVLLDARACGLPRNQAWKDRWNRGGARRHSSLRRLKSGAANWISSLPLAPKAPDMARKVVSRKEKRAEAEAAEQAQATTKKVAKKAPAKRKSRAKSAQEVRLKAFWGVFNQSLRRVALYDFNQKKEAEKKAQELSASGKSPHFVQPVKEAVEEA